MTRISGIRARNLGQAAAVAFLVSFLSVAAVAQILVCDAISRSENESASRLTKSDVSLYFFLSEACSLFSGFKLKFGSLELAKATFLKSFRKLRDVEIFFKVE